MTLGNLFVLQLLYEHYDEFIDDFTATFYKYFDVAYNKKEIKEIIIKYLFDIKFTKEELKKVIMVYESRMGKEIEAQNNKEWEQYNLTKGRTK